MTDRKPPLSKTMGVEDAPDQKAAPAPAPAPKPAAGKKAEDTILFTNPPQQKVGELFNTYRVGDKWADRVQKGDVLNLARTEGEEVVGTAEVVSVQVGQWGGVKQFAGDNHEFGQFPQAEAEQLLQGDLKRHYGEDMKSNSRITVLYLRRTS